MQVLNISEVGQVTIRKLSNRDWTILRNNIIESNPVTKQEKTNSGDFVKFLVILGIQEAPFFKSKYPEMTRLNQADLEQREDEYDFGPVTQNIMDKIFKEIKDHNVINNAEIKEISKSQSNSSKE